MEMGGNFCQILELGGTTIKGRRVTKVKRKGHCTYKNFAAKQSVLEPEQRQKRHDAES